MEPHLWNLITDAWLVAAIVWLAMAFTTKRAMKIQSPGSRLAQIAVLGLGAYLLFGGAGHSEALTARFLAGSPAIAYLGCALTFAGILFAIWARFFLGPNWSGTPMIKRDHELIRSGPYSIVRHPIYSGFLLAVLGTVIYVGEVRGLLAFALAVAGLKWKSLVEESFMQEQFGSRYFEYKRDVKALIPFVW
jgi:protein-S-isoprenylcysteine O-methyltransferase Ste14